MSVAIPPHTTSAAADANVTRAAKPDIRWVYATDLRGVKAPRAAPPAMPRASSGRALIYAHRGASAVETENTRAAFERAWRDGADGAELDVQFTKDGVAIIFHDDTTERLVKGSRPLAIADENWKTLEAVKLEGGHPIMTFEEFLFDFMPKHPGFRLNAEIKTDVDRVKTPEDEVRVAKQAKTDGIRVAQLIQRAIHKHPEMRSRVFASSFHPAAGIGVRSVDPRLPFALLHTPSANYLYGGTSVARVAKEIGASGVNTHVQTILDGDLDPKTFEALGLPLQPYNSGAANVRQPEAEGEMAAKLAAKGVLGIIVNDPGLVTRHLRSLATPAADAFE